MMASIKSGLVNLLKALGSKTAWVVAGVVLVVLLTSLSTAKLAIIAGVAMAYILKEGLAKK